MIIAIKSYRFIGTPINVTFSIVSGKSAKLNTNLFGIIKNHCDLIAINNVQLTI